MNRQQTEKALAGTKPGNKVTETLMCDLTPDEQRERGEQLAHKLNEKSRLEEEMKAQASGFKTKIKEAENQAVKLKNAVSTKRELRDVQCTEHYDYQRKRVLIVRDDTGVIARERGMTTDEIQRSLPLKGLSPAKTEGDGKTKAARAQQSL